MQALYQLEHSIRLVYIIGNLVGQLNKMLHCICNNGICTELRNKSHDAGTAFIC